MTARADAVRLTTASSALRPSAQSDPPGGVPAAAADALDELALAEAGCPALPAETDLFYFISVQSTGMAYRMDGRSQPDRDSVPEASPRHV